MYKQVIKPLLFLMQPEKAHYFAFDALKFISKLGVLKLFTSTFRKDKPQNRTILGLDFTSPVGLAAGFDKDAKLFDELAHFGFGFIEVGTVTPKAQDGNPTPRLFRLPEDNALINRMGFNNSGVDSMVERLKKRKTKIIIGGNIGKNKVTSNEEANSDYALSFNALYEHVDYFVVNVSSPNTPNLRALQDKEPLTNLLNMLVSLRNGKPSKKPILLKIAPDLSNEQLLEVSQIVLDTQIEGIIATNTTIDRSGLTTPESEVEAIGNGGLSGKPVTDKSTAVIKLLADHAKKRYVIIGVGGIHCAADAIEKLKAGADLIQVYTGFIYEGPGLIKQINKAIKKAGL